jgi:solute carrier family 25 carnitine/acylcarnitine transporter 20/29
MGAGVMAGFGLWGSMFPIDTIKSKIQADSLSKPQFNGTIDCLKRSLAVEVSSSCLAACRTCFVHCQLVRCLSCKQ